MIIMLGLLGLWGCSSDDTTGNGGAELQRVVGFATHLDEDSSHRGPAKVGATRAAGDGELTNDILKAEGFGVYCWYTGKTVFNPAFTAPNTHIKDYLGTTGYALMLNQKVEWKAWDGTNNSWGYTPQKYWPLDPSEMLTFRAYAPYTDYLVTDATTGMPMLPVVVKNTDYTNGTQHDPLWGTGKHDGATDSNDATTDNEKYGKQYDNYTYEMSGDKLAADTRDGVIDWYFHHGMSSLNFTISLTAGCGCDNVTITGITITPLYTQGLFDLGSKTESSSDKPTWKERGGDMTVTLNGATTTDNGVTWTAGDLAPTADPDKPYPFTINSDVTQPSDPVYLLSKGLLIIPRDFSSSGVTINVAYYIDGESGDQMTATATVNKNFEGNTSYTLGLSLTPETKGLKIDVVLSAFTKWDNSAVVDQTEYNW